MATARTPDTQRIDKWLWFARFFKTRSLATKYVTGGKVRVTRGKETVRIVKASHMVQAGDVLTLPLNRSIRVVEINDTGARRGPAKEAQLLYTDLSSSEDQSADKKSSSSEVHALSKTPRRADGEGRPTKKDRRALDRLHDVAR